MANTHIVTYNIINNIIITTNNDKSYHNNYNDNHDIKTEIPNIKELS